MIGRSIMQYATENFIPGTVELGLNQQRILFVLFIGGDSRKNKIYIHFPLSKLCKEGIEFILIKPTKEDFSLCLYTRVALQ